MNGQEFKLTMDMAASAARMLLLLGDDLDLALETVQRAGSVGPILYPSEFMHGADKLRDSEAFLVVARTSTPDEPEQWDRDPYLFLNGLNHLWLWDGEAAFDVEDQRPFGIFEPGRWAWIFANAVKFPAPVPAKGRQGFWRWECPAELLEAAK